MPKIKKTLRTYGRHRKRHFSLVLKEQLSDSLLDPEAVRKENINCNPIEDSHILSSFALSDDRRFVPVSNNKSLRPCGHHRNRRISITPGEEHDDSLETARRDCTTYSPVEGSFFSGHVVSQDDFSRFLSQSLRNRGTNKQLCTLNASSSESSKVFGSPGSDNILFCSLKRSPDEITESDTSFVKDPSVSLQLDVNVSQEIGVNNRKGRKKVKRQKAPRVVKKNAIIVPPSGLKNKTPQIDWNEIENYSLVVEKEVPRVSEKNHSPAALSPTALEKLRSVFHHAPLRSRNVNSSVSLFPQVASTNPSPIHNVYPKDNYPSTLCSAENSPDYSRRGSLAQKIINIKTSTPFVSLTALQRRTAAFEKTSPSSCENSLHLRSATSKITESLAATNECLNRMLNSSHNIMSDRMNNVTAASNRSSPIKRPNSSSKSENIMTCSIFRSSRVCNSAEGSKPLKEPVLTSDSVAGIYPSSAETSVSEISFLKGKALKDISSSGIRESCSLSMNRNLRDRFRHMLQPHSRENSSKVCETDHRSLIADLRKSAHRMSLNCMKKTSEPSTPVNHTGQTSVRTKAYTSVEWPRVVKPCLIAVTPLKAHAMASPQKLVCENDCSEKIECTEEDQVLELCSQEKPIPFSKAFNPKILKSCKKIGEGVYGEVFRLNHEDGSRSALKLIPVEGDFEVNGETQKTFAEILPEIVITKELSNLRGTFHNSSPNFIKVKKVMCLQGKYPPELLQEWDRYNLAKNSLNDRPDVYRNKQLFISLECVDGGTDLESVQLKNANEAVSIFVQVACTLAIAEQAVQFEHRDLHWGNILVSQCQEAEIEYTSNGQDFHVSTEGVFASVIDFTLSRLGKDGCVVYTDLSQDPSLFTGEGDYQFDVYRLTKDHNKNDWESFMPYSNVLWLHYLVDKLINEKEYKNKLSKKHKSAKRQLLHWKDTLLQYKSAMDFIVTCGIVSGKEHFGQNSTDVSGKEMNARETQQRKPLRERKGTTNITLEGKMKKDIPSSVAKLKKSSKFIASKKIIPASRAVRGSVRKGKNPIQMTLKAFNVRI